MISNTGYSPGSKTAKGPGFLISRIRDSVRVSLETVVRSKSQQIAIHVNINGTIMVKSVLEIQDVTIQPCFQGINIFQSHHFFWKILKWARWPSYIKCLINTMSSRQAVLCDWTSSRMDRSRKSNPHFKKILFQPWICSNWRQHRYWLILLLVTKKIGDRFSNAIYLRCLSTSIVIQRHLQGLFRQLQWQGSWKCQLQ